MVIGSVPESRVNTLADPLARRKTASSSEVEMVMVEREQPQLNESVTCNDNHVAAMVTKGHGCVVMATKRHGN